MSKSYNPDLTRKLHEVAAVKPAPRLDAERVAARRNPPPAFAQTALLFYEDPKEFEILRDAYIAEHNPESPTEHYFVNEMVNAQWRLKRLRLIEADLIRLRLSADPSIDDEAAQAEALRLAADSTKALNFVLRQEAALRRQFERALKMFWECRARRPETVDSVQKQKVTKQTQSASPLREFERRLREFCAAPPPLPPAEPAPAAQPGPAPLL